MLLDKMYDEFERHQGARFVVGLIPVVVFFLFFIPTRHAVGAWINRGYAAEHAIATQEAATQLTRTAKVSPEAAYALANKVHVAANKDEKDSNPDLLKDCFFVIGRRYFIPIYQWPRHADLIFGKATSTHEDGYYVDMATGQVTAVQDGQLRFPFANAVRFHEVSTDEK
jgi:hypothetical protein